MSDSLELVAFDIETTGFTVDDEVTVVGIAVPMGVRVFVQTDGQADDGIEAAVQERVETHVRVSTHASERVLLEAVGEFAADRLRGDESLCDTRIEAIHQLTTRPRVNHPLRDATR